MLHVLAVALLFQSPAPAARVIASRRELRLEFTEPVRRSWGWSDAPDSVYFAAYSWTADFEAPDGPSMVGLTVRRRAARAKRFASLAALVRSATPAICHPGMILDCAPSGTATVVADGQSQRIVVTLRDSATVARLLSTRPA